jgi:hypothetical protein
MLDRLLGLFAYLVLVAFVGVLVFKLQRLDITLVAALTLGLAGWDVLVRNKS